MQYKLFVMIVGGLLIALGVQEGRLASGGSQTPQVITCKELGERGPGANAHVTMTRYILYSADTIYHARRRGGDWDKVWVPALSVDGDYVHRVLARRAPGAKPIEPLLPPSKSEIHILVKSTRVKNPEELKALAMAGPLTGTIVNQVESLGHEEKRLLEDKFVDMDFSKCYILEHGRKPAGRAAVVALIGGGSALILLGGIWTVTGWVRAQWPASRRATEGSPRATNRPNYLQQAGDAPKAGGEAHDEWPQTT
jgi:hypothetical protein